VGDITWPAQAMLLHDAYDRGMITCNVRWTVRLVTNACGVGVDDNEAVGEQTNIILRTRDSSKADGEKFRVKFQRSRNVTV